MTPNDLLETLDLHARSSIVSIEPRDCATWAEALRFWMNSTTALASRWVNETHELKKQLREVTDQRDLAQRRIGATWHAAATKPKRKRSATFPKGRDLRSFVANPEYWAAKDAQAKEPTNQKAAALFSAEPKPKRKRAKR